MRICDRVKQLKDVGRTKTASLPLEPGVSEGSVSAGVAVSYPTRRHLAGRTSASQMYKAAAGGVIIAGKHVEQSLRRACAFRHLDRAEHGSHSAIFLGQRDRRQEPNPAVELEDVPMDSSSSAFKANVAVDRVFFPPNPVLWGSVDSARAPLAGGDNQARWHGRRALEQRPPFSQATVITTGHKVHCQPATLPTPILHLPLQANQGFCRVDWTG